MRPSWNRPTLHWQTLRARRCAWSIWLSRCSEDWRTCFATAIVPAPPRSAAWTPCSILNAEDGARSQEILAFVINVEHIGDIVANNLIEFAAKKINRGQVFSEDELRDIVAMHAHVMESLHLGLSVFLHSDVRAAQQLVEKKATLWRIENEAAERYTRRPKGQRDTDRDGGDVYLRILRDLKRIHSHLAAQAYPILERAGLLQNRLVQDAKMNPSPDRMESVGENLGASESKDG
jgi:hypothetical protein